MIRILHLKKVIKIIIIFLLIILPKTILSETNNNNQVNIYFFHSNECSHCKQEQKYLDNIKKDYPNVKIYKYEIHTLENNNLMKEVKKIYNIKTSGVPLTIIGDTPYIGYSSEKSNPIFTKTIIYYTKYNYQDKVSELLWNKNTSSNIPNGNQPTLEKFIETYGNYKLIGNLYANDLEPEITSLILGVIAQFTPIKIITTIAILIILSVIKEKKERFKYIILYFIITTILSISKLLSNNLNFIIYILTILICSCYIYYNLKKYQKTKSNQRIIYYIIITIIPIAINHIEKNLVLSHITIFTKILKLNNLTLLNKISYYGNYIFSTITINIILFILIYHISNKMRKIKLSHK